MSLSLCKRVLWQCFYVSAAFLNGFVISVNLGASGVLNKRVDGAVYVSLFNGAIAAILELVLLIALGIFARFGLISAIPPIPRGTTLRAAPKWVWLGGFIAAYTLTAGILVASEIGVTLTSLLIMTGQFVTSVLVEVLGCCKQPQRKCSAYKAAALVLVVAGSACTFMADASQNVDELGPVNTVIYSIFLLLVGVCVPFLSVVNGALCEILGHTLRAAVSSDTTTATSMLFVCIVFALAVSPPHFDSLHHAPAWSFLGGPCSTCFTCIMIWVPQRIGIAAFTCSYIAGQQFFGLLVDALGLFAVERAASPQRIAGTAVAVLGAIVYQHANQMAAREDAQSYAGEHDRA